VPLPLQQFLDPKKNLNPEKKYNCLEKNLLPRVIDLLEYTHLFEVVEGE
jgi:hypothetical protein